jgi:hypothetical protein
MRDRRCKSRGESHPATTEAAPTANGAIRMVLPARSALVSRGPNKARASIRSDSRSSDDVPSSGCVALPRRRDYRHATRMANRLIEGASGFFAVRCLPHDRNKRRRSGFVIAMAPPRVTPHHEGHQAPRQRPCLGAPPQRKKAPPLGRGLIGRSARGLGGCWDAPRTLVWTTSSTGGGSFSPARRDP